MALRTALWTDTTPQTARWLAESITNAARWAAEVFVEVFAILKEDGGFLLKEDGGKILNG